MNFGAWFVVFMVLVIASAALIGIYGRDGNAGMCFVFSVLCSFAAFSAWDVARSKADTEAMEARMELVDWFFSLPKSRRDMARTGEKEGA